VSGNSCRVDFEDKADDELDPGGKHGKVGGKIEEGMIGTMLTALDAVSCQICFSLNPIGRILILLVGSGLQRLKSRVIRCR
jgi:hypothetical protein